MNRIERVAPPAPAQQPQPRLPRALADVRRRAAHVLLQPRETATRTRRCTNRVAVAIAALTVPMLPNPAFGATPSAGVGAGAGSPQARHHLHHLNPNHVDPEPGTMTVQEWAASGWTLTVPDHPADMALLSHVLATYHHSHYVPWLAEPGRAVQPQAPATGRGVPDAGPTAHVPAHGRRPVIDAFRVSHTSPRADQPYGPESQDPVSPYGSDSARGPRSVAASAPLGDSSTERFPADLASRAAGPADPAAPAAGPAARPTLPNPMIPAAGPANTKQMLLPGRQPADIPDVPGGLARSASPRSALAASAPAPSACLPAAYLAGKDSAMVARLRPATDAMDVVVSHHRTPCAASVDYLPQARA